LHTRGVYTVAITEWVPREVVEQVEATEECGVNRDLTRMRRCPVTGVARGLRVELRRGSENPADSHL